MKQLIHQMCTNRKNQDHAYRIKGDANNIQAIQPWTSWITIMVADVLEPGHSRLPRLCPVLSYHASLYRVHRPEFAFCHDLDVVCVKSHRITLSRLIMSSNSSPIAADRWEGPPIRRQDHMCSIRHKLGDEYHFLLECLSFCHLNN